MPTLVRLALNFKRASDEPGSTGGTALVGAAVVVVIVVFVMVDNVKVADSRRTRNRRTSKLAACAPIKGESGLKQ